MTTVLVNHSVSTAHSKGGEKQKPELTWSPGKFKFYSWMFQQITRQKIYCVLCFSYFSLRWRKMGFSLNIFPLCEVQECIYFWGALAIWNLKSIFICEKLPEDITELIRNLSICFFNRAIIRTFIAKTGKNLNHGTSGVISHIQTKPAVPDRFLQSTFCIYLRNCTSLSSAEKSKSRDTIDN